MRNNLLDQEKDMMKKKVIASLVILILATGLMAAVMFFGLGNKKIEEDKGPSTYPEPIGTDSGKIKVSSTTGKPFEGEYKPVMVVVENSSGARPQTGLQTADVVYEVPVEGTITRFVAVFSDEVPQAVLPLRSGRAPFLPIQQEWDAMFMHFGGSGSGQKNPPSYTFYGNSLHGAIKIDFEGLTGYRNGMFKRVTVKRAPHNVQGNPAMAQKQYNYQPKQLEWLFDPTIYYPGDSVVNISLPFTTRDKNFVTYKYDFDKGAYLRSMTGAPFIAGETKKQMEITNLIVQYSTYTTQGGKYKDWKMTGSGKADFYMGGMHVAGTWSKASPTAPTIYLDGEGNQIVLKPGNTWIHIHPVK